MPFRRPRPTPTEDEAPSYALSRLGPTQRGSMSGYASSASGSGGGGNASGTSSGTAAARSMRVRAAKARLALGAGARARGSIDGDERQGLLRGGGGDAEGDDTDGENSPASYSRALPAVLGEEELDGTSFDERGGFEDREQQRWGATVGTPASGRSPGLVQRKSQPRRWPWGAGETKDRSRTFTFAEPGESSVMRCCH